MDVVDIIEDMEEASAKGTGSNVEALENFLPVIKVYVEKILGILVVSLIILLPIVISLEIAYIALPTVQSVFDKILFKSKGVTNKILGFSLKDAIKACQEANTVQTGKSPMLLYLKYKIKTIMIVGVVISLLLGLGTDLVWIIYRLFSGAIEQLTGVIMNR